MYPGSRDGSRLEDKENFVILLKVFVNWKIKKNFHLLPNLSYH
jgi:hypothetical protein